LGLASPEGLPGLPPAPPLPPPPPEARPREGPGEAPGAPGSQVVLKEFAGFAGLKPKDKQRADLVLALRWRAIRRFLKEGHPREKVAYWTGMKSLAVPGWGEG
jgi:integrase/recombinase XerD